MYYEHNVHKLHFFLHFGASALVWFIYLPIIALIALRVSALWRFKLLLGKLKTSVNLKPYFFITFVLIIMCIFCRNYLLSRLFSILCDDALTLAYTQ